MKSTLLKLSCALVLVLPLSSCFYTKHTVGTGGTGGSQVSHRTWYVLWGLIPISPMDSKELAAGATDYTVDTERNVVDVVLNIFTGIISFVSQTETVTR